MEQSAETDKLIHAPDIETGEISTNNIPAKKECQICGQFVCERTTACLTSCFNCWSCCFTEIANIIQEKVNCKIVVPIIVTLLIIYYTAFTNSREIGEWMFENDFDIRHFDIHETTTNGYPLNYNANYDNCYSVNATFNCIKYEPHDFKRIGDDTIDLSTLAIVVFFAWIFYGLVFVNDIRNNIWKMPVCTIFAYLCAIEFCSSIVTFCIVTYFDLAKYAVFEFYDNPIPQYFANKMVKCDVLPNHSITCYAHNSTFITIVFCVITSPVLPICLVFIYLMCIGLYYCTKSICETYSNFRNRLIQ